MGCIYYGHEDWFTYLGVKKGPHGSFLHLTFNKIIVNRLKEQNIDVYNINRNMKIG